MKEEFIKDLNNQRKTGKWYSFGTIIEGKTVIVKGYKTWLQRYIVDGINYSNCMDRTVKQFNEDILIPFKGV